MITGGTPVATEKREKPIPAAPQGGSLAPDHGEREPSPLQVMTIGITLENRIDSNR